jgi:hypothetical protein
MQLTVVFEHWHLGDGNYPAFAAGDEARLSFELDVTAVNIADEATGDEVRQVRDAEYEIVGCVIRQYQDGISSPFPIVEAGWLRFYCPSSVAANLAVGSRVKLRGHLALDHYLWVEFLDRYPDPPDLFYAVRVTRVRQVRIPSRFVTSSSKSMSHPTVVAPGEYTSDDVREVPSVEDEAEGPSFSLLDLDLLPPGAGPVRPTFFAHDV